MKPAIVSVRSLIVLFGIVAIVAALVFGYVYYRQHYEQSTSTAATTLSSEAAPYQDGNGNVVDLSAYSNTIRVVNSWATWTPFSKDELPLLNALAGEYRDRGVVFLAINRMEERAYATAYLEQLAELPNLTIIFDPSDHFFSTVEGFAMPETIIFNTKGEVVEHIRGASNADDIRAALDQLLAD